jgi:FKBP-type peptidyl-prolyl cis-trans isomerase FkpA
VRRFLLLVPALLLVAATRPPARDATPAPPDSPEVRHARQVGMPTRARVVKTPSGLQYLDVKVGQGPVVQVGRQVSCHYTGWVVGQTSPFDSSRTRAGSFDYLHGQGRLIKGWEEGATGMRVGGIRKLVIPHALGYGAGGRPPVIPPSATLIFEIEVLAIR